MTDDRRPGEFGRSAVGRYQGRVGLMRTQALGRRGAVRAALAATAMLVLTFQAGCGYSIRAPYSKEVKTVYVPVFRSITFRRDVNLQLTELVIKEIERRSTFKVVGTQEGAD